MALDDVGKSSYFVGWLERANKKWRTMTNTNKGLLCAQRYARCM